jgi:HEPN domain-containing protein
MEASAVAGALDAACFHAQPMVEEGLKAFLAYRGAAFLYTYNLAKLVEACAGIDPALRKLLPTVAPLTPYAIELRYDDSFWASQQAAEEASSSAHAVFRFVLDRLPGHIRKSAE